MPLFLSDEEFRHISHDAVAVAERADASIRDLRRQIDVLRAEADAASIAAEQSCAILEQRYESISLELDRLRSENSQLASDVERKVSEAADALAEKHQLHLKAIAKEGEVEKLSRETAELVVSKRELLTIVGHKDAEISEKNIMIGSYLDKIVSLTDSVVEKETKLQESGAELARLQAKYNRVTQEKELLEKQNVWLNAELTAKCESLLELKTKHTDAEAEMSFKLASYERQMDEYANELKISKDKIRELESRIDFLEKELHTAKDVAAANEGRFVAELSTVSKLADLYKERSEELSKKSGELQGAIKALETHLNQVENDYKAKLEKEVLLREKIEKEAVEMKGKLERYEAEMENARKSNELSLISVSGLRAEAYLDDQSIGVTDDATHDNNQIIVPKLPVGISGTALAASLLRDGWSLAKIYEKYQEVADALQHEKWGRKNAEAVLERVLHEIKEKAEMILDERAEHERMVESYALMNEKLQAAFLEHDNFEITIRNLKSELKRSERDYKVAEKEIDDLQKQVTVLLKECQDIQVRCGALSRDHGDSTVRKSVTKHDGIQELHASTTNLMTFKDINGLIEQNVQLRSLVHRFSCEDERKEADLRENFNNEIQKVTSEATAKVEAVLKKSEEQAQMIQSLHAAVAMYKRLYEEGRKSSSSGAHIETLPGDGNKELMLFSEGSQEVSKRAYDQLAERARNLEQDLSNLRGELISARAECDKKTLEADFSRNQLERTIKDFEHQRKEAHGVSARNAELSQLIVDFQRRIRECSDSLKESEDNSRKLAMEVSLLKHEKEIMINSERKASDEVRSLSERVHRLQSSLDAIQSAEEARENARAMERKKQEEHIKLVEREKADAKKELQEQRDYVRALTFETERKIEKYQTQVEQTRKELAEAWNTVAAAESRAAVAEALRIELQSRITTAEKKVIKGDNGQLLLSAMEVPEGLMEEMEKLREEAEANKKYMHQYKEIAQANEVAMKQIEAFHEEYKAEAERVKESLESNVSSLKNRVFELEKSLLLKSEEAASATDAKEKELSSLLAETSSLKIEIAEKSRQIEAMEHQISFFNETLDKEHKKWRTAQDNYERQVVLQSETIQELTDTSKELSMLQAEMVKLREICDSQKTEYDILKASWVKEKTVLQELKDEAEKKYNEVNEQNKILHNRLEALHIRLSDDKHTYVGMSPSKVDSQAESDLQQVVNFLRHSKETADNEISLLKQEKSRLQYQLDSALKASETAQALVHSQREHSRAVLFKDEEYKSLQLQVREINLLRESNMQLREENKHNFEECQKHYEGARKAKMDAEKFENLLKEKQLEFEASQEEKEKLNVEIHHLNNRILELVECHKGITLDEYERMKDELQQTKALLRVKEGEVESAKNLASVKQKDLSNLEEVLAKCRYDLAEQEKKFNDALQVEATVKQENEKHKKLHAILKKKNDVLIRERDELNKEKLSLLKQIEEAKSSRKTTGELAIDQTTKEREKDTRLQMLEKTVEKERQRRQNVENTISKLVQQVQKDRKFFEEELAKQQQAVAETSKGGGAAASQLPSESTLQGKFSSYDQSAEKLVSFASSLGDDTLGSHSLPLDTSVADVSMPTTGLQAQPLQIRHTPRLVTLTEEREKDSTVEKPKTEVLKASRKLVRPRLERPEEPQVDVEMSGIEGSRTIEDYRTGSSHEPEDILSTQPPSAARKRLASSLIPEGKEENSQQDESGSGRMPLSKKPKDSEPMQEDLEETIPFEKDETLDPAVPVDEVSEMRAPADDLEGDQGTSLPNEEDAYAAEDDDTPLKEELEEPQKAQTDVNQEDEVSGDGDAIGDESSDKLKAMDLPDEGIASDSTKEVQQASNVDEDEKEEGEVLPEEPEELQEGITGECLQEPTLSDLTGVSDDAGDAVEIASLEVHVEKDDGNDAVNVVESHDAKDQLPVGSSLSPQSSFRGRESSPGTLFPGAASQLHSSSNVTETDQSKGRTITIRERARENARLRQANIQTGQSTAQPARGRGRAASTYRRDGRGASRGGGRGRGQA